MLVVHEVVLRHHMHHAWIEDFVTHLFVQHTLSVHQALVEVIMIHSMVLTAAFPLAESGPSEIFHNCSLLRRKHG